MIKVKPLYKIRVLTQQLSVHMSAVPSVTSAVCFELLAARLRCAHLVFNFLSNLQRFMLSFQSWF